MSENKKINLILVMAVMFSSLPLFFHGIEGHFGQDLGFHINRIEGLYLEMKNGVLPVRMQPFWMEGYGYPVSIYYCDLFLYFPAFLRLLGVPVVAAYKVFLLVINIATVMVAFYSFSGITGDGLLGALGAFVYATSNYRLLDLFIRAAVGEYTALLFLPLVLYGVCALYGWCASDDGSVDGIRREAVVPLTVGMSGILLSHMMSLEIVGICLIVVCLLNLKKTFSKEILLTYLISAGFTLLITAWFTVPFVDYFTTETVRINEVVGNARQIQESGTRLYEFFDFFMIPFSNLESYITDDRMLTTPGMVLMGTVIASVALLLSHRADRRVMILTVSSMGLLFVSSDIFPWNWLGKSGALGDLLAQVQFPWRYIGIATAVITLLLLTILSGAKKYGRVAAIVISVGALMCVWFTGVYGKYAELDTFMTTADLDTYDMGFIEYLRPDAVREDFTHKIRVISGKGEVTELYRKGTAFDLFVASEKGATIELPVLNYKYYVLTDEKGREYEITDGENDEICFDVDADFEGVISLRYVVPWFWHAAELVSLISLVLFTYFCTRILFKKNE